MIVALSFCSVEGQFDSPKSETPGSPLFRRAKGLTRHRGTANDYLGMSYYKQRGLGVVTKSFVIYAALADEADDGWIWFASKLPTRTVVKVERKYDRRTSRLYCQSRQLDWNYVRHYNDARNTSNIDDDPDNWRDILVINEWYRDKLSGLETMQVVELTITAKPATWWWHWDLCAALQHPDVVARIGTRSAS